MDNWFLSSTSILGFYIAMVSIFCISIILIVMIGIVCFKMLQYELTVMKYGEHKEMEIVDVGIYDDGDTFYNTQITLCDDKGNLAVAKMIKGLVYDSPKECWKVGTKVNVKVIGGEAVLE